MTHGNGLHHRIDEQFDTFKARIHDAVDRADASASGARAWLYGIAAKARELVQRHPYASIGVAIGSGYVLFRVARRRA